MGGSQDRRPLIYPKCRAEPRHASGEILDSALYRPAPPQLPCKEPQIPSNRDHKALNRGTLGGVGGLLPFFEEPHEMGRVPGPPNPVLS